MLTYRKIRLGCMWVYYCSYGVQSVVANATDTKVDWQKSPRVTEIACLPVRTAEYGSGQERQWFTVRPALSSAGL